MANRYWVGGSGTWNSIAGTKWSTTSGGVGGASVPTSSDDVIFNGLSAPSGVVTVDTSSTRYCKSLTFSNFDGTFSASAPGGAPMEILGNLTFSINPAMVFNYDGDFKFTPNATTATITGDSKLIGNNNLEIAATGGGTVTVSDQCSFNNVTLSQGTFKIGSGIIVFVSTFTATGLYPTTINSTTPGVKGRLYKGSGTVTVNNVSIQDSDAFGGATWNAVNSTNLGNNSGWIFSAANSNAFMQFF